ncbi:MAG: outer membrane beta-barrel protein [Acidobacteriota bacterium]
MQRLSFLSVFFFMIAAISTAAAQQSSAPLPTPAITGPLQAAPPITIHAGPLGKLSLNGVLSGMGLTQTSPLPGDQSAQAELTNAQIFLQKTDGWAQFYVQAGAYNIPVLGTTILSTQSTVSDLFGPVPVAYLKLAPNKNTSVLIGSLPAIMGAEGTFDFQNMNVERGLLWNQENSINRGIQLNQTVGKLSAAVSWNDGYYSNRYSWLSGSLTYSNGPHSLSFSGMGNLSQTAFRNLATPVQNNGSMYALIYTYTKGKWIVQPYWQYGDVPTNLKAGIPQGASAQGAALLLSRTLSHGWSFAGRGEYLATTGSTAQDSVNLLYGPGSTAWSLTATPAWQEQRFFARGDVSLVHAMSITDGSAFGKSGSIQNQFRGIVEIGLLF